MHKRIPVPITRTATALFVFLCFTFLANSAALAAPLSFGTTDTLVINPNGGWCWFEDPRVLVDEEKGYLLAGTVKSPQGDIDVTVVDLKTSDSRVVTLDPAYQSDDHDSPAILKLRDGHYLAMWGPHGIFGGVKTRADANTIRWRISEKPHDPFTWGELRTWTDKQGVSYSNLFQLPDGTVLDFHRGRGFDPNYLVSADDGRTFTYGGQLLRFAGRNDTENRAGRPYLRYAQHGGRIHLIATEDHPRDYNNSIYHAYIEDGRIYHSDGREVGPVSTTETTTIQPDHLTRVFAGDPRNVAWAIDLEVDDEGRPYAAFSVQKDDHDKPRTKAGDAASGTDLRYYYARWDGRNWVVHHMAHAGSRLYPQEADYTGLVALHPHDPDVVVISTNADPATGKPLISGADGKRHHELFLGRTADGGATWQWTPLTADSPYDNLRPIVPAWKGGPTALLWLRGTFTTFRDYRQEVALRILPAHP
jgi:hypothetical protein